MPTQLIEFEAPSGMTLTAKLYTSGSDTVAYTASAVTEQTNRKGVYQATFSNVAANTYQLVATSGTTAVSIWWGYAQNTNATYQFGSNLAGVWDELMSSHTINGSYGSHLVRSQNQNQNTVQITGSNHIAADVHAFQPDVIDSASLATSAVSEIAAAVAAGGALTSSQAAQLAGVYSRVHGIPVVLSSTATNVFSGQPLTVYLGSEHSSFTPLGPITFNVSNSYNVAGWTSLLKIYESYGSPASSLISVAGVWADVGLVNQRVEFTLQETDTDNLQQNGDYVYQVELLCGAGHPYASPKGSVIIGSIHS